MREGMASLPEDVPGGRASGEGPVIGIDIGTGSVKAVAVYSSGRRGGTVQRSYGTTLSPEGGSEQDPEEIWTAFQDCLAAILEGEGVPPRALSLSAAMHSVLLVDPQGVPLTPLLLWSDSRAARIAEDLKGAPEGARFYAATGTPIGAMTPLCKMAWLRQSQPHLFAKAHKALSIKEYIWWKIFGRHEIDYSIASATGYFSITGGDWYNEALAWAGISPDLLSTPVDTAFYRTYISGALLPHLRKGTPVFIGASDGCLANLGSGALEEGVASITIGSSGAVRIASSKPLLHFPSMPFAYRLTPHRYICGGPVNNGGIVVQWALRTICGVDAPSPSDFDAFFKRIEEVPASAEGLLFLPYLAGERAPLWDAQACGTFFGLKQHHRQAHLARATVEGICFALLQTLRMLEEQTAGIREIVVSGGFIQSTTWLQILADITGKRLSVVEEGDASAVGAAFLAMDALGIPYTPPLRTASIEPDVARHQQYRPYYEVFTGLYPSLKEAMHVLHQLKS